MYCLLLLTFVTQATYEAVLEELMRSDPTQAAPAAAALANSPVFTASARHLPA